MLKGFLISTDALISVTIAIIIVTIPIINSTQQNTQSFKLLAWDYLMLNHSYFYAINNSLFLNLSLINVTESNWSAYRISPIFLSHKPLCGCSTLPCNQTISTTNACLNIAEVNTSSITNKTAYAVLNDR